MTAGLRRVDRGRGADHRHIGPRRVAGRTRRQRARWADSGADPGPLIVKWPAPWGIDPGRRSLLLAIAGASGDRGYLRTQIVFRSEDGGAWPASRALLDPGRVLAIYHPHNERRAAFDLCRDPRGLEDLAAMNAAHLRADLEAVKSETVAFFSEFGGRAEPLHEPLDPETLEELRALGYL